VAELRTRSGELIHGPSGRRATYGELSVAATAQPLPDRVTLKDPKDFTLVGKQGLRRKEVGKTDGSALYTQDVHWPGMLTAVVAHPPVVGGTRRSVEDAAARAMPGGGGGLEMRGGVAVLAETFGQADQDRKPLRLEWDEGEGASLPCPQLV